MIGIRADGNKQIGIGHIMRCLTIAEELVKQGEKVMFLLADDSCAQIVRTRGFECEILNTHYDDMVSETDVLLELIDTLNIDKMLVDSYYVTETYLKWLRKRVITFYMDDIQSFEYPVDAVINYNVFACKEDYAYLENEEMILAGPAYAPVRKEFSECKKGLSLRVENILLSVGGSDAYNLSCKISEELLQTAEYKIHVICGPFNGYKEELKELAKHEDKLVIHENVSKMWELMQQCDMAVSAAGSTMYELAVVGLPVVTFSFVDNQIKIAEEFGRKGAALMAGHYVSAAEKDFISGITQKTLMLAENIDCRRQMVQKAAELVDGRGASRIAHAIMAFQR